MNSETFSAVATCYRFLNPRIHRPRLRLSDAWLRWKPRQDVPPKWQAEGHGVVELADSMAEAHRRWCASVDRQMHKAFEEYKRRHAVSMLNCTSIQNLLCGLWMR